MKLTFISISLFHLLCLSPAGCSYFKDGLKTIAHFGTYIHELSTKLQSIRQKQDDERRKLLELRTLLRSAPDFDRVEVCIKLFNILHFIEECYAILRKL